MPIYAAIDQGTTSTRCILFDEHAKPIDSAQREHTQITPRPGWVEHDPKEILESTRAVCDRALNNAHAPRIDAIGITNQRETVVFWDRQTLEPACNAIVWQDTRTADLCEQLARPFGPDRFRERTGLPISTYFSGPKIRWALDNFPRARELANDNRLAVGTIDAWLLVNLSVQRRHATDPTNASRTLLMDLRSRAWDDEILSALAIPREILPEITPPNETIATTHADTPFGPGVPISAMIGDQQAALLGQGCTAPGSLKNTYGTGCFLLQNTGDTPVFSDAGLLTTAAHPAPGQTAAYALEGAVAIAGALVQWLRDALGIIEHAADIEPLADSVPDTAGVVIVPAFNGLFAPYWDTEARGIITGLTRAATKAHLARAALEAVCFQTRDLIESLAADTHHRPGALRVDGGMTANSLLMQLQADLLGIPVVRPSDIETTALGAATAAAAAVGSPIAPADDTRARWEPRISEQERDERYEAWQAAVARCRSRQ